MLFIIYKLIQKITIVLNVISTKFIVYKHAEDNIALKYKVTLKSLLKVYQKLQILSRRAYQIFKDHLHLGEWKLDRNNGPLSHFQVISVYLIMWSFLNSRTSY